jgi:hypothetical protein
MFAGHGGKKDFVTFLLDRGANIEAKSKVRPPATPNATPSNSKYS